MPAKPAAPKLTPEQQAYKNQLAAQVKSKGINQAQMDAEMTRYLGAPAAGAAGAEPWALQQSRQNLSQQVASGGINQAQADAEQNRLKGIYQQANPQIGNIDQTTLQGILNAASENAKRDQYYQTQGSNPNQSNPFGNQTTTYNPITGQWDVNQSLSDPNQAIVGGIQQNAQYANQQLGNIMQPGGDKAYQDAVFAQLTQDLDRKRGQEEQQLGQTLAQRGIPVGSEAYNNQMQEFNKRYDDQFANARSTAVSQGQSMRNQDIGVYQGLGQAGYMNPNFSQFQPGAYDPNTATNAYNVFNTQQLAQQQLDAQNKARGSGGSGRGSSGGGQRTATISSPFSPGEAPGG